MARRASAAGEFERVARRLEAWRRSHARGSRLPESLWGAAVDLAEIHGVSRTAGALRLGYYSLQRRLARRLAETGPSPLDSGAVSPAPFLELPGAALGAPAGCVLVLERADGLRLRIELPVGADPRTLATSLWRDAGGAG
jgi:hypothetical protein